MKKILLSGSFEQFPKIFTQMNSTNFSTEDYFRTNQMRLNEILTDLTIKIVREKERDFLNIKVHKFLILCKCESLAKLVVNCDIIDLDPAGKYDPNAFYDLLMSFYGQDSNIGNYSRWKRLATMAICCKYWSVDLPQKDISKECLVDEDDYDYFMAYCSLTFYDNDRLDVAAYCMPQDYSLSKLSNELIQKILSREKYYLSLDTGLYYQTIVKINNILNGKNMLDFSQHSGVYLVLFSPNGLYVATVSHYKVCIWNTSNALICTFDSPEKMSFTLHSSKATFTNSSTFFTIVCDFGNVLTYNLIEKTQLSNQYLSKSIYMMAYSNDDRFLVTEGSTGIDVWDVSTTLVKRCTLGKIDADYIKFTPDDKYLIVGKEAENKIGKEDGKLKIWSISTFEQYLPKKNIIMASLSNTQYIAVETYNFIDWKLEIWDLENDKIVNTLPFTGLSLKFFSPDNQYVVMQSYEREFDKDYRMYHIKTGHIYKTFKYIDKICFSPDMKHIATMDREKIIIYNFDLTIHKKIPNKNSWDTIYGQIQFAHEDKYLCCTHRYNDGLIDVFDLDGTEVKKINTVSSVNKNLLGKTLYTGFGAKLLNHLKTLS